jgi:hypothetical protein
VLDLDHAQIGDRVEQRPRRVVDVLGAQRVTRVVVGDGERQRAKLNVAEAVLAEERHQVDHRHGGAGS